VRRRRRGDLPPSRLRLVDLFAEAGTSILIRPGRAALTALGTVLGIAAFVTVLGLTSTAGNQISKRFTALAATEVTVRDNGGEYPEQSSIAFPVDSDARVRNLPGVRDAGVWWQIGGKDGHRVSGIALPGREQGVELPVVAASPGFLRAVRPTLAQGRLFDEGHDARRDQVVVLGEAAARQLGVTDVRLAPAVFIDGIPLTVTGVIKDAERRPDVLFAVLVPRNTAQELWGLPDPAGRAGMLVDTRLGAATTVAGEVALALRPDAPASFEVTPPPDPRDLRDDVSSDLGALFLMLAGVCLAIGAIGIANTTTLAVLERINEIGVRRALGARRWHIAAQFLTEGAALGLVGGAVGSSLGVSAVVIVAVARQWTPILEPAVVLLAPAMGLLVGLTAGTYPALRAARIQPVQALQR